MLFQSPKESKKMEPHLALHFSILHQLDKSEAHQNAADGNRNHDHPQILKMPRGYFFSKQQTQNDGRKDRAKIAACLKKPRSRPDDVRRTCRKHGSLQGDIAEAVADPEQREDDAFPQHRCIDKKQCEQDSARCH